MSSKYQCLICVGSTKFDELIKELDRKEFISILKANGFSSLVVQTGKGTYKPTWLLSSPDFKVQI